MGQPVTFWEKQPREESTPPFWIKADSEKQMRDETSQGDSQATPVRKGSASVRFDQEKSSVTKGPQTEVRIDYDTCEKYDK